MFEISYLVSSPVLFGGGFKVGENENLMFFCSKKIPSITKKAVMAVTGLFLLGFVLAHMAGNLLIFGGQDLLNSYAQHLEDLKPLLWVARIILLVLVALHITTAVQVTMENRKARPVAYHKAQALQTTYAARTMAFSGIIILVYIEYHLLHFTFRVTHPAISHGIDAQGRRDVYTMVVLSFRSPLLTAFYVFSMALLSMHLSHGFKSLFQSMGWNHETLEPKLAKISCGLALVIFAGYSSIPLAVLLGILKPAGGL